jgi:Pyruvate phosphate dikinase, AMP/ATP-binding domain
MSVLLQPLVDARAAFVSHSRDPRVAAGAGHGTLYVEVVAGLGESLVGNVPGRPLAFGVDRSALWSEARALLARDTIAAARSDDAGAGDPWASVMGNTVTARQLHEAVEQASEGALERLLRCVRLEAAPSKAWAVWPASATPSPAQCASGRLQRDVSAGLIARSAADTEDLEGWAAAGVFDSFATRGTEHAPAACSAVAAGGASAWREAGLGMLRIALAALEVEALLGGEQDVEGAVAWDGSVHVVQARPQGA